MSTQAEAVNNKNTGNRPKPRVFSGIQPTGNIHLGNYLGAIRNWVADQEDYLNIFCIVDLHAITLPIDPKELHAAIRRLAALYLACGLDPKYCKLFVQSHVQEHAEASWILSCYTPMGWLNRMTQFKTKAGNDMDSVGTGLYTYPVLMACDILLYQTRYVPVGNDQKQHVELTRDLAQRFNKLYKAPIFTLPEPLIRQEGARIMSLEDPGKKMSKSDPNPAAYITLLDDAKTIKKKIARATTDSQRDIVFDPTRAGIYNLLTIYQLLTNQSREAIEQEFAGKGYGDFKARLTDALVSTLEPIQQRYQEYINDLPGLEALLKQNADDIRPMAAATLNKVKAAIGLG